MREITMRLCLLSTAGLLGALLYVGCSAAPGPGTITCGAPSVEHWPVPSWPTEIPGAILCGSSQQCNAMAKPACAAKSDNTCLCTERNPKTEECTASRCLWHVDPKNVDCVCVPGTVQRCNFGTAPGYQECSTTGTSWGPCT